jgi:hypothetical protein
VFNSTLKSIVEEKKQLKKDKKNKKDKKAKKDKKNAKEKDAKTKKAQSKKLKTVASNSTSKMTLSGKVLELENSKKIKIKPFDPFQGMPENWLSDFESALQKASLDPVQNGIGQVHYFLSEEGMEW